VTTKSVDRLPALPDEKTPRPVRHGRRLQRNRGRAADRLL
jgi:hypothetical protein